MDAATAVVQLDPPLMSQMDMSGLALLTEALLEGKSVGMDGAVLPLDKPTDNDQPAEDNLQQIQQEQVEDAMNQQNGRDDEERQLAAHTEQVVEANVPEMTTSPLTNGSIDVHTPHTSHAVLVGTPGNHLQSGSDIAAYFALEFLDMQYIYYLQRSSVSLGRSSMHTNRNDGRNEGGADIDLGPLKNISRLHARIEYEEEIGGFVLAVIGRNGAFVDGTWREPGRRVPLGDRSLIQISSRAFYFILPNSSGPSNHADSSSPQFQGHSPEHEVPPLDYTVTTADDSHSHSTSSSATPKQTIRIPRRPREEVDIAIEDDEPESIDDDVDIELDDGDIYVPPIGTGGKGKGKGKEAMGPLPPVKRGRGRPRKNPLVPNQAPKPKPKEKPPPPVYKDDEEGDIEMDFADDDDEKDSGDEFVPKNAKRGTGVRGRPPGGGGGKSRAGTMSRPNVGRPRSESVIVKDEEMETTPASFGEEMEDGDEAAMEDGMPGSPSQRRSVKRKRDATEEGEGGPLEKRRKSVSKGTKAIKKEKDVKEGDKDAKAKGRKRAKPEMKSLFTTTPAPALSTIVAAKAEGEGAVDGDTKSKALGKKGKDKKGKKGDEEKKEDGEDDEVKEEEEKKPLGPPPPKPPFTYPLLCYRALKALNGKAPYRAITRWLEKEYPYFAFATKEGKDGWENSTRHTLSSHRAFIKIERGPEERGKGCFWSFDPEFEEQFKDQWRAAESQSRNPRPVRPSGPGPSGPPMFRPPFPPPPGWSGVTPPHLMPGYRPMPPGPNGAPPPFPYPPPMGMGRGMPPPGMHMPPFGPPFPPHPGMHPHPHPPFGMGPNAMQKAKPIKKPKQLGAAFSRAPLIRPGLGGVPSKSPEASSSNGVLNGSSAKPDDLVMRGSYAVFIASRAAKDELRGIAGPGTAIAVLTGNWSQHAVGKGKARPSAASKVSVVLEEPPKEALPIPPPPPNAAKSESDAKEDENESPSPSRPPPIMLPITFWDGKLYLHPRAFPGLKDEDIEKFTELTLESILSSLAERFGTKPMPHPQPMPRAATVASPGKEENTAEGDEEDELDEEPEGDAEAEAEPDAPE